MWHVYVIQHNVTNQMYIGKTKDFKRRIAEHNNGLQSATKRKFGEWVPIYLETYRDKKDADNRELRLKNHGRAKQELFKRIKNSFIA